MSGSALIALVLWLAGQPQILFRPTAAEIRAAVVTLETNHGGSIGYSDPADLRNTALFTVQLHGDGRVVYEGRSGVRTMGRRAHEVPAAGVAALIDEFRRSDFLSLDEMYASVSRDGARKSSSHSEIATLTFSIGGRTRRVRAGYGTPMVVRDLQDRVIEVSDIRRYTGRSPRDLPPGIVRGRILDSSGQPLPGVTVRLLGSVVHEEVTDTDGRYVVTGVWPSSWWVTVRHDGYVAVNHDLEVTEQQLEVEWNLSMETADSKYLAADMVRQLKSIAPYLSGCGLVSVTPTESGWTEPSAEELQRSMDCLTKGRNLVWTAIQRPSYPWSADGLVRRIGAGVQRFSFENGRLQLDECPIPAIGIDPATGRRAFVCG